MHPLVYTALPTSRDFCTFSAVVLVPVGLEAAVWSVRDPGRPFSLSAGHNSNALQWTLSLPALSAERLCVLPRPEWDCSHLPIIAIQAMVQWAEQPEIFWRGKVRPEDRLSTECDRVWNRRLLLSHRFSRLEAHRELCVMVPSWWLSPLLGLGRGFQDDSPWVIPSPHQGVLDLSLFHGPLCGLSSPEHLSGNLAWCPMACWEN